MANFDECIISHPYQGDGAGCTYVYTTTYEGDPIEPEVCGEASLDHADPRGHKPHLIDQYPHEFVKPPEGGDHCYYAEPGIIVLNRCGYPEAEHHVRRPVQVGALVRKADVAQYERAPMPAEARRGPVVTLIDAPVDPLGTMAVIGGIYKGEVRRSKSEVTDDDRRAMLDDMQSTVLNGPLECIQFTFLVEGVGRDITHQMVRNRFSFFAQESLRFAVAEDWAQEVPLPPSLASLPQDAPAVGVWRRALNQAEDSYAALIGAGMPAEEARKVLPHAITTRLYWTVSLRTLLAEAGKRTCTQAQFDWRQIFGGVAKALRERAHASGGPAPWPELEDGWQYKAFADLMRPVCYQQGRCGFMAKFDRGCTIRERVDANEKLGRPSSEWHTDSSPLGNPGQKYDGQGRLIARAIDPAEWAADPGAARVRDDG